MVSNETMNGPVIGRQLFDVITSGMYDNPLMIYREYIQNAVDSVDLGIQSGKMTLEEAAIQVNLSGHDRVVTICDNGVGLPNSSAHAILTSLGCSPKEGTSQRGFRGIGRLGGLAYCDKLIFETRSSADEKVAVISWDRFEFDAIASVPSQFVSLSDTIRKVSNVSYREGADNEPEHFFKVTLINVHRFHSDTLMNVKDVYSYLAQVAPVPYNRDVFSFSEKLNLFFSQNQDCKSYSISLNNKVILRPYTDTFLISTNVSDAIQDVECFTFYGADATPIALGWYAKTALVASLPQSLNMRGLRVRQGNIEVGDEHFLDDRFSERRFSSWHIGEIQVVNNRLKPNARRDGFEQSPDFERFLEQAFLLGRHLSGMCRRSSNSRIARYKLEDSIEKLENFFEKTVTFIDVNHYAQARDRATVIIEEAEKNVSRGINLHIKDRLDYLKHKVESSPCKPVYLEHVLDGRKLKPYSRKGLLKHVANKVTESYQECKTAEELLEKIFEAFTNEKYADQTAIASFGLLK